MQIAKKMNGKGMNIALSGKFTFQDHEMFKDVLQVIGKQASNPVVLDMEALEFVDSAALGMLLLAHDEAQKSRKKVVVTGLQGQVKKMFDTTRLDRMFEIQQAS